MEIKKTTAMNRLLDFYGDLLTSKQRTYVDLYYGEDYSLGEIAENYQVSRQAVYDNIRRTEKILQSYEYLLHLIHQYDQRRDLGDQILAYVKTNYPSDHHLMTSLADFIAIDDEIENENKEV